MSSGVDFASAQGAIIDWIDAKSGLGLGRSYWSDQDNPRLSPPYVVVSLMGLRGVGRDGTDHTEQPGGEVTTSTRGPRVLRIAMTAYSDDARALQPMQLLDRILTGAEDIAVVEAMKLKRVGIGQVDSIVPVPGIEAGTIRATVQLDVHTLSELDGTGYVFNRVEVSSDDTPDDTSDLGISVTAPPTPP